MLKAKFSLSAVLFCIVFSLCVLLSSSSYLFADELPRRGFLGAQVGIPSEELSQKGVVVLSVFPDTSAQEADIRSDDLVLTVDGNPVENPAHFAKLVGVHKGGEVVKLELKRGGESIIKQIILKEFPKETIPDGKILYHSITVEEARRRVIITRPLTVGPYPAILFIGGIGCYSADLLFDSPYKTLIYAMTKAGFVTMRVEKTGMGDSEGPNCANTDFDIEVNGYLEALKALKEYSFVDPAAIFLVGHSMGGVIAPKIATEIPIKGIIAIGTVGISWIEYELANSRRQSVLLRSAGQPDQ